MAQSSKDISEILDLLESGKEDNQLSERLEVRSFQLRDGGSILNLVHRLDLVGVSNYSDVNMRGCDL